MSLCAGARHAQHKPVVMTVCGEKTAVLAAPADSPAAPASIAWQHHQRQQVVASWSYSYVQTRKAPVELYRCCYKHGRQRIEPGGSSSNSSSSSSGSRSNGGRGSGGNSSNKKKAASIAAD